MMEGTSPNSGWVVIEVDEACRPGRGRWWRERGNGYTNQLHRAGLYAPQDLERHLPPPEDAGEREDRPVAALPLIEAEIARVQRVLVEAQEQFVALEVLRARCQAYAVEPR